MVHFNKLDTLSGLRRLVQSINASYWECYAEIARETSNSGSSGNKSTQKSDPAKFDSKSSNGSLQSKNNNNNYGSTQSKGSTSKPKEPTTDLSSKLRKDGKLTPQEHQYCLNNKLCHLWNLWTLCQGLYKNYLSFPKKTSSQD